jgi:hypothetical protein
MSTPPKTDNTLIYVIIAILVLPTLCMCSCSCSSTLSAGTAGAATASNEEEFKNLNELFSSIQTYLPFVFLLCLFIFILKKYKMIKL